MGGHFADDLGQVIIAFEALVSREAVAEDGGAGFNGAGDEGADADRGKVGKRREADAARMTFWREFDGADEMQFADGAAALTASDRIALRAIRDIAFVDLDKVFEKRPIGIDHSATQLLQHQPSGLVGTEAELRLELQGGDAVRMAGDGVDRHEPCQQREVAAVEDRAGGDRRLAAAGGAFESEGLGIERPGFGPLAFWTDEAVWPALFEEVVSAGRVVGKPLIEGGSRHRAVVFPAARHENECRTFAAAVKPVCLPMGQP